MQADDIPEIEVKPARRTIWQRVSVVWLVPLAGLAVALGIAWQTWADQGPLLTVTFDEALGVKARESELKYRDVTVGTVEEVKFSGDLGAVEVSIRVDKDIAPYVDQGAAFWVVRPEVTAQGVTGLDTVLSGVFIEGVWDTMPDGFVAAHRGLNAGPLLKPGEDGTIVTLRALPGTTLTEGTAVTYKGIEVGRVGVPEILPGAARADAPAVIYAPYDRLISSTTRFWDTSGFSLSLGASGPNLEFTSLASLIAGGVAFDTVVSGGAPMRGRPIFDLYGSEDDARTAVFEEGAGNRINLSIIFDENAAGLAVGAPVQLGGIAVGEVTSVSGIVDPLRFRDTRVRLMVVIELAPALLGLADPGDEEAVLDFFAGQVEDGLRARLATASLLTGGLRVELLRVSGAPVAALDRSASPHPLLPTTASEIADAGATAQGILERVNDLPIEEVMQAAIDFLNASTVLVSDGDLAEIPRDVRSILADVRDVTASDGIQGLPEQVSAILNDVSAATGDVRRLLATIEQAEAVNRLLAAVDEVGAAAGSVTGSVAGVPELVASLTETAEVARTLPLETLIDEASGAVAAANALLASEGAQDLPVTLSAALDELTLSMAELREGGAVANLNASLASAEAATAAIANAAEALPGIATRLNATLATATETLESYGENAPLGRDARAALAEISRAARAIESLARTIERNPNSLILGR